MIYKPEQDSYLLAKQVKHFVKNLNKNSDIKILDMGSGSGIQAITTIKAGIKKENVLCADINSEAIEYLKKQNLNTVTSDLFSKISKEKKFDLIIFNAPYLPADKYDKQPDTTAGKCGNEIIIKFLRQAKTYLADDGVILLLFSSLSHPEEILREAKKLKYDAEKLSEENVGMMETIFVYKFWIK